MKLSNLASALCAAILFCALANAAVPQLINYQGILKDGSGNPVADGNYSVVFTIYDAPSAGNILWSETQSITTSSGLFTVLLGNVTPVADSAFNESTRYFGIKVGADAEITPRHRLISAAYSFRTAHFVPDFGTGNTFIGENAGNLTMTGSSNTAGGAFALQSNTTGNNNSATGVSALRLNITGSQNTASGREALVSNTTGNNCTASGFSALPNNTTGNGNTACGSNALFFNTTGGLNTASGVDAIQRNVAGSNATAVGTRAMQFANNTSTPYTNTNVALGYEALRGSASPSANTGLANTALGYQSLFNNSTGSNNTASGLSALLNNTTGNYNTAIGFLTLQSNITGSNNTVIGYLADVSVDSLTNATAIGNGAIVNASDKIRLGNTDVTVIEGEVAYTFTSDKDQKENFRPVDANEVLKKIRGLELSSWNYKGHDHEKFRHYGPMAQDFYAAFGDDGVGQIGTETTLNSGDVAGILMIAVQALGNENADLKARIENLEEMLKEIQSARSIAKTN